MPAITANGTVATQTTVKELYESGILSGIARDPAGIPYIFGPDGKAQLDPNSPVIMEKPLARSPR